MSKSLQDALDEKAWSVSAVIFDLNAMHDDEGRPISERRADAMARVGVEMEMRKCPFNDIRDNKWMNVSALTQIAHYYNDVLAEMAAFRSKTKNNNSPDSWDDILAGVVDLLAGPAIYLLQQRNLQDPVPAKIAVGHKLAAGMFGVLHDLNERLALGDTIPVTTDSFLNLIDETGALVGASEACAGSMPMIRKACTALLEGIADTCVELDPLRFDLARCLALQVRLGSFWYLYDRFHLWSLVVGEYRNQLIPFNRFLERKIEYAGSTLTKHLPPKANSAMLPSTLDAKLRKTLAAALNNTADPQILQQDLHTVTELLNETDNAICYNGDTELFAINIANYLNAYRLFKAEISRVELELRKHLGFSAEPPILLGTAVFPSPKALHWYELILGRKLGEDDRLTGSSIKIRGAAAG